MRGCGAAHRETETQGSTPEDSPQLYILKEDIYIITAVPRRDGLVMADVVVSVNFTARQQHARGTIWLVFEPAPPPPRYRASYSAHDGRALYEVCWETL